MFCTIAKPRIPISKTALCKTPSYIVLSSLHEVWARVAELYSPVPTSNRNWPRWPNGRLPKIRRHTAHGRCWMLLKVQLSTYARQPVGPVPSLSWAAAMACSFSGLRHCSEAQAGPFPTACVSPTCLGFARLVVTASPTHFFFRVSYVSSPSTAPHILRHYSYI